MFKSLSLLIHKTPWWGLLLGGVLAVMALVLFSAPLGVWRLSSHATSPDQKRAIQHEINQAFKDGGLSVAEGILTQMKDGAKDPERRLELERALNDIARARDDNGSAQAEAQSDVQQAAKEAAQDARDAARDAAESALEAAHDAVEAAQESKDEALSALRDKGLDVSATEKSFDELIKTANAKVLQAQQSLDALNRPAERAAPKRPGSATAPASVPTHPNKSAAQATAQVASAASAAAALLTPQAREDIRQRVSSDLWRVGVGSVVLLAFIPLFVVLLIAKYFIDRSHRALAFAEEKSAEAQLSDLQRQMTEARLQALQAQIEPHFLYNTLANVQALTEIDPPSAHKLVGHLIEYLRAALPKMRASTSTVGQELERARAYLNILKMRMRDRLDFEVRADNSLLPLSFPPMMLPTLVENAIKHGLEPKREGGRIDIVVAREVRVGQERLLLRVTDTGLGLTMGDGQTGGGIGLSNLRERLRALYGDQAQFSLQSNQPSGVVACIDLPLNAVAAGAAPDLPSAPLPTPAAAPSSAATAAGALAAPSLWQRFWRVTRKTHGVWAKLMSRMFLLLMVLLVVGFFAAIIGLLTGTMPVQINDLEIVGMPAMAMGSVGLLLAFAVAAIVVAVVVLVLYSLGFVIFGILLVVLAIILAVLFPVLSPFILAGVIIWALWRNKRRRDLNSFHAKKI